MDDRDNPYAAPRANVGGPLHPEAGDDTGNDRLLEEPLRVPARNGMAWVATTWQYFRRAPVTLVLMLLAYFIIGALAGLVPVAGDLAMSVTLAFWGAAWALVADRIRCGEAPAVGDLFAGFRHPRAGALLGVGIAYVAMALAMMVVLALAAAAMFGLDFMNSIDRLEPSTVVWQLLVLFTIILVGIFLVFACISYAPVLVLFHGLPVMQACTLSFRGFTRNWPALTVSGLAFMGLGIACIATLGLGFLVLFPMMLMAAAVSYRDIFLEQPGTM